MTLSRRRRLHAERERAARGRLGARGCRNPRPEPACALVGVAVAAVNLIAALTSIEAYPLWALVIVGIDVLVIYGLAAYGDGSSGRPA
jgi:hypothetical protein